MPVLLLLPLVMPSVSVGSTPLWSIISSTALGSWPMGGIRMCELWALAIHAMATCSAVAPSWCVHVTSQLAFSSSRATGALPAASAVFSGGVLMRGSRASGSARNSSSVRTTSAEPDQHAVWITATFTVSSSALGSPRASSSTRNVFGQGAASGAPGCLWPAQATTSWGGTWMPVFSTSRAAASHSLPRLSLSSTAIACCLMASTSAPAMASAGGARPRPRPPPAEKRCGGGRGGRRRPGAPRGPSSSPSS
mmetsp:Transcript_43586/g.113396  ORF Transcript_43586/g.113396 Transcript_43586/m.113396 type:complete len:251 (-) Transcript_43586:77-829(-)